MRTTQSQIALGEGALGLDSVAQPTSAPCWLTTPLRPYSPCNSFAVIICVCEELRQLPRKQRMENEGYHRLHEIARGLSPTGMRKWEALKELFADSLQREALSSGASITPAGNSQAGRPRVWTWAVGQQTGGDGLQRLC